MSVATRMRGRQTVSRHVLLVKLDLNNFELFARERTQLMVLSICLPNQIWAFPPPDSVHVIPFSPPQTFVLFSNVKLPEFLTLFQALLYLPGFWWHLPVPLNSCRLITQSINYVIYDPTTTYILLFFPPFSF